MIHSTVIIGDHVIIGDKTDIAEFCVIGDNVVIGNRCQIGPSAYIDAGAKIGDDCKIWHFCHVRGGAVIGPDCSFGQNCYIGGVTIGSRVRVQNNVSIYEMISLEDDVFVGPSVVFTNDPYPPALSKADWKPIRVKRGAAIGANTTILAGVIIGEWALIGAGAVVIRDIPSGVVAVGNPARITGKRKGITGL